MIKVKSHYNLLIQTAEFTKITGVLKIVPKNPNCHLHPGGDFPLKLVLWLLGVLVQRLALLVEPLPQRGVGGYDGHLRLQVSLYGTLAKVWGTYQS